MFLGQTTELGLLKKCSVRGLYHVKIDGQEM